LTAAERRVLLNSSNLSSGPYFYRLQIPIFFQTRKMLLVR
jgi:hypothetical protein